VTGRLVWPPTQDQWAEILGELGEWAQQNPDKFKREVREFARVAQNIAALRQRIESAGFAEHPVDYLLRPVSARWISYTVLKDPNANIDLADIVTINDALDRRPGEKDAEKIERANAAYQSHRDSFFRDHGHYPSRGEDRKWGQSINPPIGQVLIAALRKRYLPHGRRGRPKSASKSPRKQKIHSGRNLIKENIC
jgi:hypothetical protein